MNGVFLIIYTDDSTKQNLVTKGSSVVLYTLLKLIRFQMIPLCIVW